MRHFKPLLTAGGIKNDADAANPDSLREEEYIIFCDFDGTITENDNIIAIIRHFNPPGWEPI